MTMAISFVLLLLAADSQSVTTVRAGTRVDAKLQSEVNTGRSEIGDIVVAVVTVPLRASSGVVVPRGSHLSGRVETIQPATQSEEGRVRLVFRDIQLPDGRHISTWITNSFEAPAPKRALRYLVYMAAGGAAGGFIGGNSARAAGILGGLIAGFVIAGSRDDSKFPNLTLHPGATLHLQFGEDLAIPSQ